MIMRTHKSSLDHHLKTTQASWSVTGIFLKGHGALPALGSFLHLMIPNFVQQPLLIIKSHPCHGCQHAYHYHEEAQYPSQMMELAKTEMYLPQKHVMQTVNL
jgi:hypothetical protein